MAHIVVLDQDPLREQWYASALDGHVLSFVETALAAVRMVQAVPTAAIVAEYFDGSGPRLLEELGRLVRHCCFVPPPVFLTGEMKGADAAERATLLARNRGARDFILHPITRQRFREIIDAATITVTPTNPGVVPVGGVVTMRITRLQPPPTTAPELAKLTMTLPNVRALINETIGSGEFIRLLKAATERCAPEQVQLSCAGLGIWATEDSPALYAVEVIRRLGNRRRSPLGELKYRIAERLLFNRTA